MTNTENNTGVFGGVVNNDYDYGYQEFIDLGNGFTLSIIRGSFSYGQWEAAVIDQKTDMLTYDTDLTWDVERFRNTSEVQEFINKGRTMDSNGKLPKSPD